MENKVKTLIHRISSWYFDRSALPYWCILALDCSTVFISGLAVYYIRYGGQGLVSNFWPVVCGMMLCLVIYTAVFMFFHTFRGVMRYSSFVDLHRVAYSTATAGAIVCFLHQAEVHFHLSQYMLLPRAESSVLIFIIATMLMWTIRVLVKTMHDMYAGASASKKVFVFGCMSGGVALAKSIRTESPARYQLAGFITGDESLDGSWLLGVKVYYDNDSVVQVMKEKEVGVLLVSPLQTQRFTNRSSLIDALMDAGIKILMMSPAEEWDGKSDLSHNQLREVEIEDLLPREKIEVDMEAIGCMLRGKRILITGAAGSIGSEMARQVAKFMPRELILVDQAETPMHDVRLWMANYLKTLANVPEDQKPAIRTIVGSITNQEHMEELFMTHRPEYVFHAAAYKHVPMMEDNPAMAVQNNIYGTRVIADLAVKYGTRKFVMISTDKAVNPTNVMGCSKRICEIYCQALNKAILDGTCPLPLAQGVEAAHTQFITTRFGNVLGSNGSVIPIFREQIRKGGPVMVTHPDIIRFFMLIPEACRLVLEAGTMGRGGEIFVFDMGEPVRIVDLAKRMIMLSGAKGVEIKFSGLRDGEKLYEEVLNDAEQTKPTVHPKIKVAAVREYPFELARQNEMDLLELSRSFDDMEIVRKMKQIVPEYKSRQSKYEALDQEQEQHGQETSFDI